MVDKNLTTNEIIENLTLIYFQTESLQENKEKIKNKLEETKFGVLIFNVLKSKEKSKEKFYYSQKYKEKYNDFNELKKKLETFFDLSFYNDFKNLINKKKDSNYEKRYSEFENEINRIHVFLQSNKKFENIFERKNQVINLSKNSIEINNEEVSISIFNESYPEFFGNKQQTKLLFLDLPGGKLYSEEFDKIPYNQELDMDILKGSIISFITTNQLSYY